MQQPPRLLPSEGSGAGHRSGAAPASVPPLTPRKKGEGLDNLVRSLEDQYQLGFRVRTELRSPARNKTAADAVAQRIQYLYYSNEPALDDALATFATTAAFIGKDQRLDVLSNILRSKTQHESPISRSGTPISAKNVTLKTLKTPHLSVEDTLRSRGLFGNYRQDTAPSLRTAIPSAGSPTDEEEEEEEFVTSSSPRATSRSPSPSVTSKSAKRRFEASAHLSLQGTAQKRPSSSLIENGKSSKLTKTSKGKQPLIKPTLPVSTKPATSLFKKPALNMKRSSNTLPASQSTVNTSFDTVSSSQQTLLDTANTSFTSDADHKEVPHAFLTRTSSTVAGSLNDQHFLAGNAKLSEEAVTLDRRVEPSGSCSQGRDSSSTWGSSTPEEDLLDASARVEPLYDVSPSVSRRASSQRQAQQIDSLQKGSQPVLSPVKDGILTHSRSATTSFIQSFSSPPCVSAKLSPDKSALQTDNSSNGVTPTQPQQRLPRERTPIESPSKIAHHIRDIPGQGLFVSEPAPRLRVMPYFALFICQRVALEHSIPLTELVCNMDFESACTDPKVFWGRLLEHPKIACIRSKDSGRLWTAAERSFEGFTFKGQINLRSKQSGPIFRLDLHPILPDKSCRFQRKYGADRFLYLNVPNLYVKKWNGGTREELKLIRERWDRWLHTEHTFLSRKWRVFHVEPVKKAKIKGRDAEATHSFRIVLFATIGYGIDGECIVGKMLDWFLPFAQNLDQSLCKAYARFDLGLSRTTPTLVFKPFQIIPIRDTKANGDREATEFDDACLEWGQIPSGQVMNDGCSVISVGAALEIWKLYKKLSGITGPLPSAFQGRIGGAKGLWMVSNESFTKDPEHLAIWIKISDSQLKFQPHPEDKSDSTFDPLRLTFEVSNYSSTPAHSELHISFIPIMADRGVPRDAIAEYMNECLDADRSELLERVTDPVKLNDYVHKNSTTSRDNSDIPWQAALPLALEERIKLQLESGFSPLKLQVLAENVSRFVRKRYLHQESKLKTPLGKATYLYGVADPLGVLEPGEVHIQFSSSFVDELTDEKYLNLRGHSLLVARQPAIRNSDIQRVRAVHCSKLSHLVDVVVFPSKGQFPLAGKLQGGDYDGDRFWLCWEDRLVKPFRNAPAPVEKLDPELYNIKVNREKLEDLRLDVNDKSSVDDFLQRAFVFTSAPSLLGIVTNFFEKQSYLENCLSSFKLDRLADLHDLLVDAAKQGYTFTFADWHSYLRGKLDCDTNLKQPVYKDAMDVCAAAKSYGTDLDKIREQKYEYKVDHIVDYLYFEIVRSHNVATMKQLQKTLSSATEADADLLYPRQQLDALKDPVIDEELRRTVEEIDRSYREWNVITHKDRKDGGFDDFAKAAEDLYTRFQAIKPVNTDHPTINSWLHPWLGADFCLWDKFRASILYARLQTPKAQTFVFQMAGDELAKIKAERFRRTRCMIADIRANMKPKPIRGAIQDDYDDDVDEDDDVVDVVE